MIQIDLSDKTILMTGAFGGIAEGVVPRLLEAGARMILTDILPPARAEEKLAPWSAYRAQFEYRVMDVLDGPACEDVVTSVFRDHAGLNIVLGHAGGCQLHPFATTSREEFDRLIAFNLTGQSHVARPVLREWVAHGTAGHLIFTSTFVSRLPWKGISAYCSAKAGVEMLAKCLALEYAPHRIRVNCIAPGNVAAGKSKETYERDAEYRAAVDRLSPLGTRNSARGIADAFLYLCSSLADEMDGQILQVDAGVGLPKLV
jgi:NAD(P)-dependent dehydrogenase (short-subunit alcohol dehydrogenase family)